MKDVERYPLVDKELSDEEASTVPVYYFVKEGVLMRKWRPPDVPANDEWRVHYQIVVPKQYRQDILSLAHENLFEGHFGVTKTCDKILCHIFWPGLIYDVMEFCKSYHSCQLVRKPNWKISTTPLKPIPAFEEPFSRVIMDCVGPLPKTKSGNQYM